MEASLWSHCLRALEAELPEQQFNTWMRPLQAVEAERSPAAARAQPLRGRLGPRPTCSPASRSCCAAPVAARRAGVAIEVGSRAAGATGSRDRPPRRHRRGGRRRVLGARLNPDFTFDSFVEGKSNHFAKAAALQVAENPGKAYNPLFIYGGVGLGKTHLMHAIGHLIRERNPDARVAYVHSERFVSDMVRALQHNTHQRVQERLPLAARAADRRHPVLRRQGALAGGILPHLQRAARGPAPGDPDLRSLSEGGRRARGAAEIALRLGTDGRDRAAGAGNLRRDPDRQGAGGGRRTARGSGLFHRQAHPLQRARAGGRAAPRDRQRALHRPADHAGIRQGSAARTC